MVDVVTLAFAITFTLLVASQTALYSNASTDTVEHLFGMDGAGAARLYDEEAFMKQANFLVGNYWHLANVSLSKLWHLRDRNGEIVRPLLVIEAFQHGLVSQTIAIILRSSFFLCS